MFDTFWFDTLKKPFLMPPSEVFAPAWIILYLTILISLIIYVKTFSRKDKTQGYIYFVIQLILNISWTPVFFSMENIVLALIVIVLLDIFVYLTIREFYKVSQSAAAILIPYFVWIIFATYLNLALLILN